MKKYLFIGLFMMLTLAFVSESNAQTVSGSISKGAAKGKTVRAYVVLNIPGGYHVNSRYPKSEYLIPTTVNVSTSGGVKLGKVQYPAGKNRKYSYSDSAISVYEGRTVFSFVVIVPKNFRGDTVKIRAAVKFQPCTDEVCYAPKTKEVTLTARVR